MLVGQFPKSAFTDFNTLFKCFFFYHTISVEIDRSPQASDSDISDQDVAKPSWGIKRKQRAVFTELDLGCINSHFKVIVNGTPSKKIRKGTFDKLYNDEALAGLRKRYGKQAILSKVRTERKKFLKK